MNDERLTFLLRAPDVVETVVRATLRAALDARRVHERTIDSRDFANEALAQLDRANLPLNMRPDGVARHELAAATLHAATAFAMSRVGRRLLSIDTRRLATAPNGADVAVRDSRERVHFVRLENFTSDAGRVACSREIVAAAGATANALRVPVIHFFSLRTARFRSFSASGDVAANMHRAGSHAA